MRIAPLMMFTPAFGQAADVPPPPRTETVVQYQAPAERGDSISWEKATAYVDTKAEPTTVEPKAISKAATEAVSDAAGGVKPSVIADTTLYMKDYPDEPMKFRFINTKGAEGKVFNKVELEFLHHGVTGNPKHVVYDLEYFSKDLKNGKEQMFFGFGDSAKGGKGLFAFFEEAIPGIEAFFKNPKRFICAIPIKK